MKVLLFGDFSGFHSALKSGLQELGISAKLAGSGDGFKKIPVDVNYYPAEKWKRNKLLFAGLKQLSVFKKTKELSGFDVVQFIGPTLFKNSFPNYSWLFNKYIYRRVMRNNGNVFLVACGSDPVFHHLGKHSLSYNPLDADHEYRNKKKVVSEKRIYIEWNKELARSSSLVIPASYEYLVGYKQLNGINLAPIIPMPIMCTDFKYKPNIISNNKIRIFHGISRPGYKGTPLILKALERIKFDFTDCVDVIVREKLPLESYLKEVSQSNILVDQCYSYGYGMNALIGLCMGKIVLSGAETEHLTELNMDSCPVINIRPNIEHIYEQIKKIILDRKNITNLGKESRKFVEEHHDARIIAGKYLDLWQRHGLRTDTRDKYARTTSF